MALFILSSSSEWEEQKWKKREKENREEVREQEVQESMLSGYIYHGPIRQEETGAH